MEASEKETEYTEDLPVNEEEEPPCSVRQKKPTEKMRTYQEEEAHKKEKRLIKVYDQWKRQVRMAREQLKGDITNSQIASLMDILEKERDGVINVYTEIKEIITPCSDTRRLIDACEAVTNDIIRVAYERLSGIDDYDSGKVKARLRELLNPDYAQSIYSSSITYLSKRSDASNSNSARSVVVVKRAEAAAELAAKEAEYEVLLEEEKQRERIQLLEERQRKELESQKRELERLKAEKELKAARARLITYDHEIKSESSVHVDSTRAAQKASIVSAPIQVPKSNIVSTSPPQADVLYLAQALQDSVTMNRLPMPESSTFTGDPIEFIEWKASFAALIDKRNISPADKLYYLKKYVGGSARQTLDVIFYRNDSDAYQDAWERLNQRW
ncbi:eukaryotic translation initiation factor 3 subunit A-like [Xiphophorus couchianus]|uniref:eukaryotic translation initiation factor 3 subunit A-like n=1 Tax=Xiphophorus couchianus TaxID=32473 RepID=UPI001015E5B8|nr:eukaryotic translation initiation factor 3 subunit A-like [Xiphophorus couchianus]